ncbi:sensor histidine kinase [Cryptosporangium arvum]|uniref:histidine kinase n=1 Tax=Cryptosporangium arvum DSM 44712 TaxID=927661 RepID=A0A010ZT43_9ACTN|nr:HAMP domain-containing sensor histidine kinase [Cryptosporangium arvum]EXG80382.1 signal transduction histidine kinase [Cryptosporangium arvum DSM 44712]
MVTTPPLAPNAAGKSPGRRSGRLRKRKLTGKGTGTVGVRRSLRLLRWRLTVLYTVVAGCGLIALATLAVNTDNHLRETRLDNSMETRARTAVALVYFTDSGIQLQDIRQDEVATGSPQLVVLLGYPPQRSVFASSDPALTVTASHLNGVAAQAIDLGGIVRTDGEDDRGHPTRLLAAPLYDNEGTAAGAVVVIGDPTDGDEEHEKLVAALILGCVTLVTLAALAGHALSGRSMRPAVDALERQEAFLADAAHDLRTPVATLRTLAEAALADPAQRSDLLPRAVALSARMGDIIDDLLTRARLNAGVQHLNKELLRLDLLVESIVDQLADPVGGPGARAQVTFHSEECTVRADAHLVTRAVANLVENALKHGHHPGVAPEVDVVVLRPGRITVSDRGPGIDPNVASALFGRFRSDGGSIGLGLSITLWAADLHGGKLTTAARPGGGAVFELVIPA